MVAWIESLPNGHYTQHLSAEDLAKELIDLLKIISIL